MSNKRGAESGNSPAQKKLEVSEGEEWMDLDWNPDTGPSLSPANYLISPETPPNLSGLLSDSNRGSQSQIPSSISLPRLAANPFTSSKTMPAIWSLKVMTSYA